MKTSIDSRIIELAKKVIADGKNKRVIAALKVMLKTGSISTDKLQDMGYNHPPRAIGDVRDTGIPIITGSSTSKKTGRRMAIYSFGDPDSIQEGRIGGRSAFPKKFKAEVIAHYGSIDCITGAKLNERVLQIDHRIPYRVAGEPAFAKLVVEDFMLLDGSSQRAKSWSCEHCANLTGIRDVKVCGSCFWAYPDSYEHIATENIRRTDIVWQGADVAIHDELKKASVNTGVGVAELIRNLARQAKRSS
jgi:hypothetical protein